MNNKQATNNLMYGRHPIMEALQSGQKFDKIFIQKGLRGDFFSKIHQLSKELAIPTQLVPIEKLNRLTNRKNHQGIVGFAALIPYYTVEDVLSKAYDEGEIPLFLLCDGITDVRNFGAIARTAACAGVHGIVITAKGTAPINSEALKASAGALQQMAVCKVRFLDKTIRYLQDNGLQIVASTLAEQSKLIQSIDLTIPTAIIIGSEGKGIAPKHQKMADQLAKIPIVGQFDSYNVSVATGMLLYETMRQRLAIV